MRKRQIISIQMDADNPNKIILTTRVPSIKTLITTQSRDSAPHNHRSPKYRRIRMSWLEASFLDPRMERLDQQRCQILLLHPQLSNNTEKTEMKTMRMDIETEVVVVDLLEEAAQLEEEEAVHTFEEEKEAFGDTRITLTY